MAENSEAGMNDKFGIVANVISDRVLRTGAKVWIMRVNGDAACPLVIGMTKSGRMIEKYTHFKRLTNFRAVWIPEHLRGRIAKFSDDKAEMQRSAEFLGKMWAGVRFFHRDGRLMQDGIPEEGAFDRAREMYKARNNGHE